MSFLLTIVSQTGRNFIQTWGSQLLNLVTISLSVLIFSFFLLSYTNMIQAGKQLGDDLRLVAYLDEEPSPALQEEYKRKILKFDTVKKIVFVSRKDAFERFKKELDTDRDVLTDMPEDFLPPSLEVYPRRSLNSLTRIKRFSDYLLTMPGVLKVQYGRQWIERFYSFVRLMRIVVILSGSLLILTSTFMIARTIRLTLLSRQRELELLRLCGASSAYIRAPYFLEGALQGLLGAALGLAALYVLFRWITLQFSGSALFSFFPFTFFSLPVIAVIVGLSTLFCAGGSFSSTRKILQV
ncbi:MAG TPA: FtsX-like permease family protein [Desulfobulbaceae bacterium]|nr:FtsX-like permease family protein [Desulfobulbaceae bacterium]